MGGSLEISEPNYMYILTASSATDPRNYRKASNYTYVGHCKVDPGLGVPDQNINRNKSRFPKDRVGGSPYTENQN